MYALTVEDGACMQKRFAEFEKLFDRTKVSGISLFLRLGRVETLWRLLLYACMHVLYAFAILFQDILHNAVLKIYLNLQHLVPEAIGAPPKKKFLMSDTKLIEKRKLWVTSFCQFLLQKHSRKWALLLISKINYYITCFFFENNPSFLQAVNSPAIVANSSG